MKSKSTVIYAPSGYGKSYLILRTADNLRKKGYRIKVITADPEEIKKAQEAIQKAEAIMRGEKVE